MGIMAKVTPFFKFLRKTSSIIIPKHDDPPPKPETLENILKDENLTKLFHEWSAQNLCSENLLFYFEVEKYKNIRDYNFMKAEAYVRPRAVAEVNLDYDCREAIETDLENPTSTLFDEAKFVVLDLLKYDLYLKFLDSDIYRKSKGTHRGKCKTKKSRTTKASVAGSLDRLSGLPSNHRFPVQRRRNVNIDEMPHITHEQISSLAKCLRDPLALDEFLKFAYTEFSDAVVQFYLDVERFEQHPSLEFACTIFNKYLSETSDDEVDADPKIKRQIRQQLQLEQCPSNLFFSVKLQLYSIMVQDNFMRFQNHVISSLAMI